MKPTKLFFRLLFCTFMLNVCFMSAQQNNDGCGTPEPTQPDPVGVYSYSTDPSELENCEIKVFNIRFWGVNYPNGINDYPNRAHDVLEGLANLNILYNQFGIYFKFRGFEEFDSPVIANDPTGFYVLETISQYYDMVNWAKANGYHDDNAFNVYAYGWSSFGAGIASAIISMDCGISSGNLITHGLPHEIGHNLGLIHTNSISEHATRDPNDICFNATTAGDRVVDTNANRGFDFNNTDPIDCEYIGDEKDYCTVRTPYFITNADIINTMRSSDNGLGCKEIYLTMGQGIRIRNIIDVGHFNDALTDVSSLYEPYAGEYFYSSTQGSPLNFKPLFQPGFDYKFFECSCDCPLPSNYNDTSFYYNNNAVLTISKYETDFSIITHPNHTAIFIDLVSPCVANGQLTRRCYDNYNNKPGWGSVTKFNDGVLNGNVTVTPKDSLGINNPTLVDELNPGLYKIEKNYLDGATDQDIIYKEN
ncbi:hypothetical protein [Flavobacterium beibuense]|uniref:hypothetical protein n=1 Tax=Flavobacterium beibuense TaxID=657326 RepID=UPI003A8F6742